MGTEKSKKKSRIVCMTNEKNLLRKYMHLFSFLCLLKNQLTFKKKKFTRIQQ